MLCSNSDVEGLNKKDLEKELGTVQTDIILKRYARYGQCFTTTKPIVTLEKENVKYIDDIYNYELIDGEKEKFNFTDGCGNISKDLCKIIAKKLGY